MLSSMQFDPSLFIWVSVLARWLKLRLAACEWWSRAVLLRSTAAVIGALLFGIAPRPIVHAAESAGNDPRRPSSLASSTQSYTLSRTDETLLDQIQQAGVRYFLEQSNPETGLTRDRAANVQAALTAGGDVASPTQAIGHKGPASLAATGFALTAWCIADSRHWVAPGEARQRVQTTLRFAANHLEQVHGWFYHFVDATTGRHTRDSEVSTIDTALFLQGAIFAREYLHDAETTKFVNRIYRRIDWRWAENGRLTLSMGWTPKTGFIPYRWDSYCELMGMYLLGMGAPAQALPWEAWDAWRRPRETIAGHTFIQCSPLFTHQYSHAWFDFRGVTDGFADYWQNSVDATLAQRTWSAEQRSRYPHWSKTLWGLTASDGPHGYRAWGTPGPAKDESDGTLVPCAPGGSLPFAPRECLSDLEHMRALEGNRVWGRYGFSDAFNPETGWVDRDVIGIDVGITVVMAENLRSGLVWRNFMHAPEVQRGMRVAGFVKERPATTSPNIARANGARTGADRG